LRNLRLEEKGQRIASLFESFRKNAGTSKIKMNCENGGGKEPELRSRKVEGNTQAPKSGRAKGGRYRSVKGNYWEIQPSKK